MAADPVAKAIEDLNRTLRGIESKIHQQNHILKDLVSKNSSSSVPTESSVEASPPKDEEEIYIPKIYGWSMAASVQREGGLRVGDIKNEQDNSYWCWTGDNWERMEEPPHGD